MAIDWTPARISTLMALWAEGISTLEIGRRLGVTKNAVVGKVHRLGLPKRQSPINSTPRKREPKPDNARRVAPRQVQKPKEVPQGTIFGMENLSAGMCNWPEGEPGTEHFNFCGQPAVEGKPYCEAHCERAYVRTSKDRGAKTVAA